MLIRLTARHGPGKQAAATGLLCISHALARLFSKRMAQRKTLWLSCYASFRGSALSPFISTSATN